MKIDTSDLFRPIELAKIKMNLISVDNWDENRKFASYHRNNEKIVDFGHEMQKQSQKFLAKSRK